MLQRTQIQNLDQQNGMLVKYSVKTPLEDQNTSNSVTLVPRLGYSLNLLEEIIDILKGEKDNLKKSNESIITDFDGTDKTHLKAIKLEHTVIFSLEILLQTKKKMVGITGVNNIPELLPSSIPMIRTVSAQLFDVAPNCSQKLSKLSVHLGSIVLDSAALTKARFDFGQSNEESSALLDEVKLMVDSKISKQYPNLDFFKLHNT